MKPELRCAVLICFLWREAPAKFRDNVISRHTEGHIHNSASPPFHTPDFKGIHFSAVVPNSVTVIKKKWQYHHLHLPELLNKKVNQGLKMPAALSGPSHPRFVARPKAAYRLRNICIVCSLQDIYCLKNHSTFSPKANYSFGRLGSFNII